MAVEPIVDTGLYLVGDGGVYEVGCAYLYGCGSSHKELDGILGRRDTAKSDDRYLDGTCNLPHHAHSHGLEAAVDAFERLANSVVTIAVKES